MSVFTTATGGLQGMLGSVLKFTGMRSLLSVHDISVRVHYRWYAKPAAKGKGKATVKEVLKGPEVCKDPALLTTHAMGVNIYKTGKDPELKPDTEYPDWLFTLNLGPPKKLEELDPESLEYWRRLRKYHMWRHNRLHKGKTM
ncbi:39S ribosomal protein L54, mitochondrial [Protopterus annectens]|uniref:39S ribosomal protein L54, mitochondrial n=1 Tax=Protopterus annectens TaxID=7888 RepID=UPI001CFA7437|nr:39S ribosomal protein L54, mitochondrial [Protopterus annectens]